jgi:hypothetical protein
MKVNIHYIEHTRTDYEREYPWDEDKAERLPYSLGKCKRITVETVDVKSAWMKFVEDLKRDGWKLYTWDAVIKGDIVIHGVNVADALKPNHRFGYCIRDVISEIAPNAQKEWFE